MKKVIVSLLAAISMTMISGCNHASQNNSTTNSDSANVDNVTDSAKVDNVVDSIVSENAIDSAAVAAELEKQEDKICLKLLKSIHSVDGSVDIFEDRWVKKHCTARMRNVLIKEYVYSKEPGEVAYASWIIGGWGPGEEISLTATKFTALGNGYYSVTFKSEDDFIIGKRVLKYKILVENGVAKIDEVKMVRDVSYKEDAFN